MKEYKHSSLVDYLSKYIDVISALKVPESERLTDREKEYFIACMLCVGLGMSLISNEGMSFIEEKAYLRNKDIYNYRTRLRDKGWLVNTKDSIELPDIFDPTKNKSLFKKVGFKFVLVNEEV